MDIINNILEMGCKLSFLYVCYVILRKLNGIQSPLQITNVEQHTDYPTNPIYRSPAKDKVAELDPSVIAPFLRDPPKPSGGFGKKL